MVLGAVTHAFFLETLKTMNFVRCFKRLSIPMSSSVLFGRQSRTVSHFTKPNDIDKQRDSTIYALSSGHGKCGVSVIRVSGPEAQTCLQRLCKRDTFTPRKTLLCKLFHPESDEHLDTGLVIWFPPPHSFTGEPCCELQVHGGSAVIASVFDALHCLPGLVPAEAGEFTMRAFKNNKLDLTEVEGLADLIHAETESQRKQALRQMGGSLSDIYGGWRNRLVKCLANSVAYIDFSEEENIEENVLQTVHDEVSAILAEVEQHLSDNRRGERLRNGIHVTIIGEPNVGKSSLLNLLCRRPAAIVSPIAGTTRDVIDSALDIAGYPVLLRDTAGLRETQDVIEKEGVARALKTAYDADIRVVMMDATKLMSSITCDHLSLCVENDVKNVALTYMQELGLTNPSLQSQSNVEEYEEGRFFSNSSDKSTISGSNSVTQQKRESVRATELFRNSIIVLNKVDLIRDSQSLQKLNILMSELASSGEVLNICTVSCLKEEGVDSFLEILKEKLTLLCSSNTSSSPSLTQARHRYHLNKCVECLREYLHFESDDIVLATEALRNSLRQIGKITGQITSEEVLDVVFRDFCIGK